MCLGICNRCLLTCCHLLMHVFKFLFFDFRNVRLSKSTLLVTTKVSQDQRDRVLQSLVKRLRVPQNLPSPQNRLGGAGTIALERLMEKMAPMTLKPSQVPEKRTYLPVSEFEKRVSIMKETLAPEIHQLVSGLLLDRGFRTRTSFKRPYEPVKKSIIPGLYTSSGLAKRVRRSPSPEPKPNRQPEPKPRPTYQEPRSSYRPSQRGRRSSSRGRREQPVRERFTSLRKRDSSPLEQENLST